MCIRFFFNDTATTEIYTLSLHDALPICLIISAARGINVSQLINKLVRFYEKSFIDKKITLHVGNSKLISFIHSNAEVISTKYEDESVIIKFRADITNYNKIKRKINENTKINT